MKTTLFNKIDGILLVEHGIFFLAATRACFRRKKENNENNHDPVASEWEICISRLQAFIQMTLLYSHTYKNEHLSHVLIRFQYRM
jgi:hypothetical protein